MGLFKGDTRSADYTSSWVWEIFPGQCTDCSGRKLICAGIGQEYERDGHRMRATFNTETPKTLNPKPEEPDQSLRAAPSLSPLWL